MVCARASDLCCRSLSTTTPQLRRIGLAIHFLTASGAVAGIIALQHIIDGNIRGGLLWLIACQVLDGIDGPIARNYGASEHANKIDGHVLDLVVDYVTCVVVPVVLMLQTKMVYRSLSMTAAGLVLLSSALWFARTDQETDDHWFRGFPAGWNIVIPSLLLLQASPRVVLATIVVLSALQLTDLKFPHVLRVDALRGVTLAVTGVYFGCFTYLSVTYSAEGATWMRVVMMTGPLYLTLLVAARTWAPRWFGNGASADEPTTGGTP